MSRSNPTDHLANPSTRWFEWNGETGTVRYYDKDRKESVVVGETFGFVLLDQLGSVKGWHEASQSGIYSNEVRDTRADVLVVKAFKLPTPLAEGLYKSIKDRVNTVGGQFVANCYIAFKGDNGLTLGSIKFKGAALGAWMEFCKAHRAEIYKQAIEIVGSTEGKKGRVIFKTPKFAIKPLSDASNDQAVKLDKTLQEYLSAYLKRNKRDQIDTIEAEPPHVSDEEVAGLVDISPSEDEIPF